MWQVGPSTLPCFKVFLELSLAQIYTDIPSGETLLHSEYHTNKGIFYQNAQRGSFLLLQRGHTRAATTNR